MKKKILSLVLLVCCLVSCSFFLTGCKDGEEGLTPILSKSDEYDIIFYLRPEFDMVEDGTRSVNSEFRDETLNIFEKHILSKISEDAMLSNDMGMDFHNIFLLTGSVKDRLKQIKQIYKDKLESLED